MPLLSFYHYSCYKSIIEIHLFLLLNATYIVWLNSNCLSCAKSAVSSLSSTKCVSSMSAHNLRVCVSHFILMKWQISTFISSGLWVQHPNLNSLNYKICIGSQQRVCLRKIHNVNEPTLWHGFEQRVINNATDEWRKRLWVCKRTIF